MCDTDDLGFSNAAIFRAGDYFCKVMIERVKVAMFIMKEGATNKTVQRVADWDDDRDTDSCGDYFRLCSEVWDHGSMWDCGCSHGTHENIKFVSDFVVDWDKHNQDLSIQRKKAKIKSLQDELEKLKD